MMNSVDSPALAALRSLVPQPEPTTQLLQHLWQIINTANPILLPNTIQENNLLNYSAYSSQGNVLVNGTDAAYDQDSSIFQNMHAGAQCSGKDFGNVGSGVRPDVLLDDAVGKSSIFPQKEDMLPALVSASSTDEPCGVKHMMNQTNVQAETLPAASCSSGFETWEKLLNDGDGEDYFYKDLINDP